MGNRSSVGLVACGLLMFLGCKPSTSPGVVKASPPPVVEVAEPFQDAAAARLNGDERAALAACVGDWAREHSPEDAGRMCACVLRGLRSASGLKVIDGALLKPWPSRSLVASATFGKCIKAFAAQNKARCEAEERRKGGDPKICSSCGSGGCEEDFEERIAMRLGYVRVERELGNLQDAPQHAWAPLVEQRFQEACANAGRSRAACGCLLKFARIQYTADQFKKDELQSVLSPSNAWRGYVEGCELFHDGPARGG